MGHGAVGIELGTQECRLRLDGDLRPVELGGHQGGDAAGRIATGLDLAAVRIPDPHEDIGLLALFQRDDLIATDRAIARGQAFELFCARRDFAPARIQHGEIVPQAIHLEEPDAGARGLNWSCS